MVPEDFDAKQNEDGYVYAHRNTVLRFPRRNQKFAFLEILRKREIPKTITWISEIRYFDNIIMAQILRDIALLKKEQQEYQGARNFFEYFVLLTAKEKDLRKQTERLCAVRFIDIK
jgi:hypothetical protein